MTSAYWIQWEKSDLDSWEGKDFIDDDDDDETDFDHVKDDTILQKDCCPRCSSNGCNYCLMTEW